MFLSGSRQSHSPSLLKASAVVYATMPRFATRTPSADVVRARALLATYITRPGKSGMQLSRESGVPQYTISRFLTGRTKSLTPEIEKVLVYASNGISKCITALTADPRIQRALGSAWDGTEQGAALLASAIDALAPVIRSSRPK